jgi:hypothetical protein
VMVSMEEVEEETGAEVRYPAALHPVDFGVVGAEKVGLVTVTP